jgi:uncharacterized protein (DUF983 family)
MTTDTPSDTDTVDCPACEGEGYRLRDGVYRSCQTCGGCGLNRAALDAARSHAGPTYRLAL